LAEENETVLVLLRDRNSQSIANVDFLPEAEEYWNDSASSVNEKLETFPKYVSRETITKFLARNELFVKQLAIHGSIVELGVGRGAGLFTWAHLSSIYEPSNYTREIIGFDTFTGFPSLTRNDTSFAGASDELHIGGLSVGSNMKNDIERAAVLHDKTRFLGHIPKIRIVDGEIESTVPDFLTSNPHLIVSLLHLDADLYSPTCCALEHLVPRIPKGGLIVFDELNNRRFPGETIAAHELLGISAMELNRLPYCPTVSYLIRR